MSNSTFLVQVFRSPEAYREMVEHAESLGAPEPEDAVMDGVMEALENDHARCIVTVPYIKETITWMVAEQISEQEERERCQQELEADFLLETPFYQVHDDAELYPLDSQV